MKSAKVLIVEDERVVAMVLQDMLRERGYVVVGTVASGEAAIEQAKHLAPDLVLMDINLEGEMNGIDAAERIMKSSRTPVVFLTAYSSEETLARATLNAPYGYLVKPIDPRELHATIQVALARRASEAAVEQSEERLRLALDSAQLGVWEWRAETRRFVAGGRLKSILEEVPEVSTDGVAALLTRVHPTDRESVECAIAEAERSQESQSASFRWVRRDGRVRWIEAYLRAWSATAVSGARMIGIVKDITERREMEEQLRQAMAVYQTMAEAVLVMDRRHRVISVNAAFTEITGYAADEVVGHDPDELLHARRLGDHLYPRLTAIEQGQWSGESHCRRKNGEVFPAWESISVIKDAAGAVTHYIVALADMTAMRQTQAQLSHLTHYDTLTGLPNRLLLNDTLDHALSTAARERRRCAVLFFDLDSFKVINDTLGHANGDSLLRNVAQRIKASLRHGDTAARFGGDEFVVILENVSGPEEAARLARKLLDVLSAPVEVAGQQLRVTACAGVSIFPAQGTDRDTLIKAADTATYNAKAQGRDRVCVYTPEMAAHAAERLDVEQGLRRALENQEFVIHYQPLMATEGQTVTGIEALLRWQHKQAGLLLPARFISIAEEMGLMQALGKWVLTTACTQAARWVAEPDAKFRLAINVSAQQLLSDDFVDTVQGALAQARFPANRMELELTESTLQSVIHNQHVLRELKALGVGLAIDDFGTGYSSLSALRKLPIDRIKIDRSFLQDLPGNEKDRAIVSGVVALSHALGLGVTAEGVETEAQLDLLREFGCEEAQGYWYGKPMAAEAFANSLM
jgi:diguanylate cyclase (GGDEF)-like protein/PAS domain S-box-containing protein